MEVAGPLGTPLGLAQRKRASPRGEAGTSGFLCADDARGWPCPFVLCLPPQGCLRRGVRASGPSQGRTGESGPFGLWPHPRGSSRISSCKELPAQKRRQTWHITEQDDSRSEKSAAARGPRARGDNAVAILAGVQGLRAQGHGRYVDWERAPRPDHKEAQFIFLNCSITS